MWLSLNANFRLKTFRLRMMVLGLLSMVFFVTGCTTYNVATGRREFIIIPTADEVAMGQNIHYDLTRRYEFVTDGPELERVRTIGQKLALISDRQDFQYNFYVIDEDELNAFTVPGGNIYVYSGLLKKLSRDDQIAAVLAHEIGHCAARHTVKKFQAALGYNLIGSLVLGQLEPGAGQQIAAQSTGMVMNVIFSAYGRQDEFEADRLGVKYMYLAGYDVQGMVETLGILKKESNGPELPLILKTHPHLDDRIKAVNEEIKTVKERYG